jgi:hypothetical protein
MPKPYIEKILVSISSERSAAAINVLDDTVSHENPIEQQVIVE